MSAPVTLRGRLTRDPEMRFSSNGKPITRFAVVTSRRAKNQQTGDWEDKDTTFWECVAFGQLAENVADALLKGAAVIVVGSAAQEEWEAKDGTKRRSMKVIADDIAPSLRFASAKVMKADRKGAADVREEADPWQGDQPPF